MCPIGIKALLFPKRLFHQKSEQVSRTKGTVGGTPEQVQAELAKADKGAVLAVNGTANPMGCLAAVDISASVATGAMVPGMVPVGTATNPARTTVKTAGAAVEEMGVAAKVA